MNKNSLKMTVIGAGLMLTGVVIGVKIAEKLFVWGINDMIAKDKLKKIRKQNDISKITFQTRKEAEEVRSNILDIMAEYGVVTVADVFDLIGEESKFTDIHIGWKEFPASTIAIQGSVYGYKLTLPIPVDLDYKQQ